MRPPAPRFYRFDRSLFEALLTSVGTRGDRNALTLNGLAHTFAEPSVDMSRDNWRGKIRGLRDASFLRIDLEAFDGDTERLRELADALNRAGARTASGNSVDVGLLLQPLRGVNETVAALELEIEQITCDRDELRHKLEVCESTESTGESVSQVSNPALLESPCESTDPNTEDVRVDQEGASLTVNRQRFRRRSVLGWAATMGVLGTLVFGFQLWSGAGMEALGPFPSNLPRIGALLKGASKAPVYVAVDTAAYGGFLPEEFRSYYEALRNQASCDRPACGVRLLLPLRAAREALRTRQMADPVFLERLRTDGTLRDWCESGQGAPCLEGVDKGIDSRKRRKLLSYLIAQDRNMFQDLCCPIAGVPRSGLRCRVIPELPPVFLWASGVEAIVGIPQLAGRDRSWSFATRSAPLVRRLRERWLDLWRIGAEPTAECHDVSHSAL